MNLKKFILLVLSASWTLSGLAQTPDTLDARGYFPLTVGNVWEYEHHLYRPATPARPTDQSEIRFERYEITSRAIQDSVEVFEIAFLEHDDLLDVIRTENLLVHFEKGSASITGTNLTGILKHLTCLGSDFLPTDPLDDGCWPFVFSTTTVFPALFGAEEVVVKVLSYSALAIALVHNVGLTGTEGGCEPCGALDDRDEWTLTYAAVSGKVFGVSIVATEIPQLPSSRRLKLYPNPASSWIIVESDPREAVQLFDITGKLVMHFQPTSGRLTVDLQGLPRGVYLVRVGQEKGSFILQ